MLYSYAKYKKKLSFVYIDLLNILIVKVLVCFLDPSGSRNFKKILKAKVSRRLNLSVTF